MAAIPLLLSVRPSYMRLGSGNPSPSPGITESGLFRAANPLDVPLWYDGRNIVFRDGGPQKYPGWTSLFTTGSGQIVRGADALQDESSVSRLFLGDKASLYMWDGASMTTPGTGYNGVVAQVGQVPATTWSFARYGNFMTATNGIDPAQVWKGSGSFIPLGGVTFSKAQIMLRRGPHLLAFNTSNGSQWYEWCDADNPEIWTPLATNAAGNQPIRDMDGPIVAAVNFGEQIAVLGKNELYLVSYTGAPFFFPYGQGPQGIGAVSKTSVVEANRNLFGMSATGFWQSDGVTFSYIDTPALRDYLTTQIDTNNLSKVCATYDAFNQMVMWSLPTSGTGENTFSIGYRIPNQSWTIFDFGRTAMVPQMGPFSNPIMISGMGTVYKHNSGLSADGSAVTNYIQSKPLDMMDDQAFKYVNRIMVQLRRLADVVNLRVGTQLNLTDAITWSSSMALDAGFSKVDYQAPGARFVSLDIRSSSTTADWAMSGFDLYGAVGGGI